MTNDHREHPSAQPEYQDPLGCLPRIFWMMLGPLGLLLATLKVYMSAGWTVADVLVWLIIGLLIGARYIDIVRFKGQTINEQPATMAHFRPYALLVLVAGTAMWVAARALGPGFN
jgi:uncharacterized membrane protein YdcZ (DUF606 family)